MLYQQHLPQCACFILHCPACMLDIFPLLNQEIRQLHQSLSLTFTLPVMQSFKRRSLGSSSELATRVSAATVHPTRHHTPHSSTRSSHFPLVVWVHHPTTSHPHITRHPQSRPATPAYSTAAPASPTRPTPSPTAPPSQTTLGVPKPTAPQMRPPLGRTTSLARHRSKPRQTAVQASSQANPRETPSITRLSTAARCRFQSAKASPPHMHRVLPPLPPTQEQQGTSGPPLRIPPPEAVSLTAGRMTLGTQFPHAVWVNHRTGTSVSCKRTGDSHVARPSPSTPAARQPQPMPSPRSTLCRRGRSSNRSSSSPPTPPSVLRC